MVKNRITGSSCHIYSLSRTGSQAAVATSTVCKGISRREQGNTRCSQLNFKQTGHAFVDIHKDDGNKMHSQVQDEMKCSWHARAAHAMQRSNGKKTCPQSIVLHATTRAKINMHACTPSMHALPCKCLSTHSPVDRALSMPGAAHAMLCIRAKVKPMIRPAAINARNCHDECFHNLKGWSACPELHVQLGNAVYVGQGDIDAHGDDFATQQEKSAFSPVERVVSMPRAAHAMPYM